MGIDEELDQLTEQELSALEAEIDRKAVEVKQAHYYALGVKMAQDAVAAFEADGTVTPALHLAKTAIEGAEEKKEVDAWLETLSTEDLADLEARIDADNEDSKSAGEYAEHYYGMGVQMAREYVKDFLKSAAGKPPVAGAKGTLGGLFKGVTKVPVGPAALIGAGGFLAAKMTDK